MDFGAIGCLVIFADFEYSPKDIFEYWMAIHSSLTLGLNASAVLSIGWKLRLPSAPKHHNWKLSSFGWKWIQFNFYLAFGILCFSLFCFNLPRGWLFSQNNLDLKNAYQVFSPDNIEVSPEVQKRSSVLVLCKLNKWMGRQQFYSKKIVGWEIRVRFGKLRWWWL